MGWMFVASFFCVCVSVFLTRHVVSQTRPICSHFVPKTLLQSAPSNVAGAWPRVWVGQQLLLAILWRAADALGLDRCGWAAVAASIASDAEMHVQDDTGSDSDDDDNIIGDPDVAGPVVGACAGGMRAVDIDFQSADGRCSEVSVLRG